MDAAHPYASLTPDRVLDALERVGIRGDGRLLALSSYENRVYQVGQDDGPGVVTKFYRPGRWSDAAIGDATSISSVLQSAQRWVGLSAKPGTSSSCDCTT